MTKRPSIADVLANVTGIRIVGQGTYVAPGQKPPRRELRTVLAFTVGDEKQTAWTAATPLLIHSNLDLDPGDRVAIEIRVTPAATPKRERRRG